MARIVSWLLAAILLAGCATLGWEREDRPLLLVEGRRWDAPLLNPDPPAYGLGKPGGCIPMSELRVEIDRLAYDPATDHLRMEGRIRDSSGGPTVDPGYFVTRGADGEFVNTTTAHPDSAFSLRVHLEANPTIIIQAPHYRALEVDLRALARRASPRPPTRR